MGKINKTNVSDNLVKGLGINVVTEPIPSEYNNSVQPIYDVSNEPITIVKGGSGTGSSVSVYTAPSDVDTYILGLTLSVAKDNLCDLATGRVNINLTVGGATISALGISTFTLTAQSLNNSISFPHPGIRIDRGSNVTLSRGTTTAGTCSLTGNIFGYNK